MFGMIIGDVLHLIFLIVGLFGSFQYRVNYVVAVSIKVVFISVVVYFVLFLVHSVVAVVVSMEYIHYLQLLESRGFKQGNPLIRILKSNFLDNLVSSKYDPIVLNLNTGRKSWWLINSVGCTGSIFTNETIWSTPQTFDIPNQYQSINSIETFILRNCIIPFHWIEIVHSSALIFFSVCNIAFR